MVINGYAMVKLPRNHKFLIPPYTESKNKVDMPLTDDCDFQIFVVSTEEVRTNM